MGEVLGYARVSTTDQDARLQHNALSKYGCTRVFTDTASGTLAHREQFARLQDQLRDGDTLVVWHLDRLGRSVSHLIEQLEGLQARGVGFVSIQEAIDTTTPGGRLVFHVFSALAQFERDLIVERTTAGLAAARARPGRWPAEKTLEAAGRHCPFLVLVRVGQCRTDRTDLRGQPLYDLSRT